MEPDPDEHNHPGEEDLEWKSGHAKNAKPKGLYSHASETARGFISTEKQCALFCGGKKCKYCSAEGWAPEETVIRGLYSEWVTDNILAMARPSNDSIKKYDIVQQFLDEGINSIVNLQMSGEHAECGPHKLDASGFLYNPQTFMEKEIFFYNFGWSDYGVASLSSILDMVKVMQFAVSQGKVAVHCHAGRGRTGVLIACYLVFTNRITGREAIHYVREKRPNSIQTRPQMQVIQEFEQYLQPFRTVYASRLKGSHEVSLQQFLNRQRHILHGYEARRLKFVPKIIYTVCERLLELAKKGSSLQRQLDSATKRSHSDLKKTFSTVSSSSTSTPNNSSHIRVQQSSSKDSIITKRKKPSLLAVRSKLKSLSMEDLADDKFKSVLDEPKSEILSTASSHSGLNDVFDNDDNDIVYGNSTTDLHSAVNSSTSTNQPGVSGITNNHSQGPSNTRHLNGRQSSPYSEIDSQPGTPSTWSIDQSVAVGDLSEDCVQAVAYALSADKIDTYVKERVEKYEDELNTTDSAWVSLATEGDYHVLGLLLWDWLDQLREPVLRAQDLHIILKMIDDPTVGLQKLEKGPRYTIEYLVKVISKLQPIKERTLLNLYEKLLSHLTQQWVIYGDSTDGLDHTDSWSGSTRGHDGVQLGGCHGKDHWTTMRASIAEQLFLFFHNLQMSVDSKNKGRAPRK